eukprot:TRINITY_DN209_c0_g1_i2.p1 TRINITY_DN209_c0_g1~~TRINITY_DN209_c0_g1_i2.p1  ORF type:complete len:162 (+),score=39.26 TRINITY_DN209_c0_g1_i2:783-1268(+)
MLRQFLSTRSTFSPTQGIIRSQKWNTTQRKRSYHVSGQVMEEKLYKVNWILKDGSTLVTEHAAGINFLELAHEFNIDLEGACDCSLACSTCHIIVEKDEDYDKLDEPTDEEYDMLDLAFGQTDTSRLGCQIILNEETDGITVRIPQASRNMFVDGHVPQPH